MSSFRPVRWRGPRPAVAAVQARQRRAAARPQLHVVDGLRAVDGLRRRAKFTTSRLGLQAVAALATSTSAEEAHQALLALDHRAARS